MNVLLTKNKNNLHGANTNQVVLTLSLIIKILTRHDISYRFMGSIVSSALHGNIYRKINDLDLLIEKDKEIIFINELLKNGYKQKKKNHLRFSELMNLRIYQHPKLLEISYFGINFLHDKLGEIKSGNITIQIFKETIRLTRYQLKGIDFIGIPSSVVYKTILYNRSNPIRDKEIEMFKKNRIRPYEGILYKIKLFNLDVTFISKFGNFLLGFIGCIRMRLGLSYNMWK